MKNIDAIINNMDVLIAELYGSQIAALDTAPDWAQSPFMDKETLSQLFKNAKSAKNEKTAKNSMVKRGDLASRVEYMLGEFSEIRSIFFGSIRFGRSKLDRVDPNTNSGSTRMRTHSGP